MGQRLHTEEWRAIPSTGRDIRLLVMRPTVSARPPERTPGILRIHGGGHVFGLYRALMLARARSLVDKFGAVVVVPEHRCALESPFPADLEDCYAALLYLKAHAEDLGLNDSQIMVGGESAGGGLTVATCLLARDLGEVSIAFQMPPYPMLDDRDTPSSRNNHAPVWNTWSNHHAWRLYLRGIRPAPVPAYAAPARETDYAGLPPAYTCVGDIEPFYCETLDYVENLRRAGVEAHLDVYPRWFHAYDMLLPFTPKAKLAIARFEERYRYAADHYLAPQRS